MRKLRIFLALNRDESTVREVEESIYWKQKHFENWNKKNYQDLIQCAVFIKEKSCNFSVVGFIKMHLDNTHTWNVRGQRNHHCVYIDNSSVESRERWSEMSLRFCAVGYTGRQQQVRTSSEPGSCNRIVNWPRDNIYIGLSKW